MVAWKMTLKTPEYPEGRSIVVIANDLTHQIGSFGPEEDRLFLAASQYARRSAIPRIYLAANSGARIGLANEIKHLFKVAWEDQQEPDKVNLETKIIYHPPPPVFQRFYFSLHLQGFKYLYLTPDDYKRVSAMNSVKAELLEEEDESRYKILDIIGKY